MHCQVTKYMSCFEISYERKLKESSSKKKSFKALSYIIRQNNDKHNLCITKEISKKEYESISSRDYFGTSED